MVQRALTCPACRACPTETFAVRRYRAEGFDNGGWVGCDREAWRLRVMLAVFVFLLAVFVFFVLAEWSSLVYHCWLISKIRCITHLLRAALGRGILVLFGTTGTVPRHGVVVPNCLWESQAARAIRTAALGMGCPTSTGGLSTWWSTTALQGARELPPGSGECSSWGVLPT